MSDIRNRRNSLLKSSLSINSIRNTVVNFTKGLVSSRETATEIVKKTNDVRRAKFNVEYITLGNSTVDIHLFFF